MKHRPRKSLRRRKLNLNTETIRRLTPQQLDKIQGGASLPCTAGGTTELSLFLPCDTVGG